MDAPHGLRTSRAGVVAACVVVEKRRRKVSLFRNGVVSKRNTIALGRNPVGGKPFEGDGKTPEGTGVVPGRRSDSAFHLALRVFYPSPVDRAAAAQARGRAPGGDIMIHGIRNGPGFLGSLHRVYD